MPDRKAILTGWSRVADYLFGRNALIGVASFMLLVISGYATWAGMHDFIIGVSSSGGASQSSQAPGGFSVSHDFLVVAVVIALTFLMWLALRESFGAGRSWKERVITFPLYVFLALWSIGFGYGFWWSLIAGQEATKTGIAGLQEDARDAGGAITARLDAVRVQLDSVVSWSDGQMSREEASGGSCGVASGAGRGPLYNARRSVKDQISNLRDSVAKSWLGPTQTDLQQMQQNASADDGSGDVADRQKRFEARAADIRSRARAIAARSNELGRSTATEMNAIAGSVSVAPGQTGFACYDPTLAQRLKQAAEQADQPATLRLREAAFNEGPAGTANAIKNLWANIGSYTGGLIRYVFTAGQASDLKTSGGTPITGRDLIALLATVGIDLGLLVLALLDPPTTPPVRRDGLNEMQQNLHQVPEAVANQLRGAIATAIARAPGTNLEWVHRHFIHHAGTFDRSWLRRIREVKPTSASYLVIPNLYRVDQQKDGEELRALAMNQLAGVFSDLKLVRPLTEAELKALSKEEQRDSFTDLTTIRDEHRMAQGKTVEPGKKALRNHGLLSKAQRTLDIAGWSPRAQSDVEIYRVVDVEGLTPLLAVLNDTKDHLAEPTRTVAELQRGIAKPALPSTPTAPTS